MLIYAFTLIIKTIYSGPTIHPKNIVSSIYQDYEERYIDSNIKNVSKINVHLNLNYLLIISHLI